MNIFFPGWWFQPIWKICSSNWKSFPNFLGWKFKKSLKPPPSHLFFPNWLKSSQWVMIIPIYFLSDFLDRHSSTRHGPLHRFQRLRSHHQRTSGLGSRFCWKPRIFNPISTQPQRKDPGFFFTSKIRLEMTCYSWFGACFFCILSRKRKIFLSEIGSTKSSAVLLYNSFGSSQSWPPINTILCIWNFTEITGK